MTNTHNSYLWLHQHDYISQQYTHVLHLLETKNNKSFDLYGLGIERRHPTSLVVLDMGPRYWRLARQAQAIPNLTLNPEPPICVDQYL